MQKICYCRYIVFEMLSKVQRLLRNIPELFFKIWLFKIVQYFLKVNQVIRYVMVIYLLSTVHSIFQSFWNCTIRAQLQSDMKKKNPNYFWIHYWKVGLDFCLISQDFSEFEKFPVIYILYQVNVGNFFS